jgi:hypothetical protein
MTRKLKTLGVALFAVLAMSAVVASAAPAAKLTAASYPVTYTASQAATEPHVFKADGFETTCKNAEFSGELTGASEEFELTPTYSECTSAGLEATIHMNGCKYKYKFTTETAADWDAHLALVCPAGKDVTITSGFGVCVTHIPPQSGKGNVTITNDHPRIRKHSFVSGLKAVLTKVSGFLCPFSGNTTVENATYTGNLTISGSSTLSID